MPEIVVYTKPYCPYCHDAKALLKQKNAAFVEIDVSRDRDAFDAMVRKSGGRVTVPQIFIGAAHVGGCDDLYALDARGGLDPLLREPAA